MTGESAAERSLHAKVAAFASWAREENPTARTAPARAAAEQRFLKLADPNGELPEHERQRRAEALRKQHYASMQLKSAAARRARRAGAPL
jgi:hypothetical protein